MPRRLPHQVDPRVGRAADLRIWCAASSTGQEPYSLAIAITALETIAREFGKTVDLKHPGERHLEANVLEDGACEGRYRLAKDVEPVPADP